MLNFFVTNLHFFAKTAEECRADQAKTFFGLPTWYKYLEVSENGDPLGNCSFTINKLTDYWLIGLSVIDILLRISALAAIGYVIFGGFKYMTSQGEPDATSQALRSIIYALIGLAIAVAASAIVSFLAGQISKA
jgi:hypothetical protein